MISLPERSSLATNELVFPVTLPPLGFAVYGVQKLEGRNFKLNYLCNHTKREKKVSNTI